jgi:hypothetical protein
LNRTPASASNRKTWTWSGWVKRTTINNTGQNLFSTDNGSSTTIGQLFFNDNILEFNCYASSAYQWRLITTQVWRDLSAWYHIVAVVDTTQATSSNRVKLYVNGVQITAFTTATYPSLNFDGAYNLNQPHYVGAAITSSGYLNGYLTEVNFIDGQALTPSSFGMTDPITGVWEPLKYSGTYGTNGFYLNFKDATSTTTLGLDYSGNSNTWTTNNFSVTAGAGNDSLTDVPTPWIAFNTTGDVGGIVRGNYATWNPLDKDDGITSVTNGNLNVVTNGSNGSIKSTIAFPSGKWYWEVTSDTVNSGGTQVVGIIPQSQPPTNNMSDSGKLGYALDVSFSDRKFENGTATSYGTYTQANGAIYMLAFDQAAGKLWYGINGTWLASGDPAAGTNASSSSISTSTTYCAAVSDNTVSGTFTANFGQRPFAYTPPSGFLSLCTTNLPASTVLKGGDYFNALTYTGNNTAGRSVTGVGFQPDFVWFKERSEARDHVLFDAVRTAGKFLISNTTDAEDTATSMMSAFNSDGFTIGQSSYTNANTQTYVAWNWKANGAGVTNTAGSITSTVSANTTSGFSIVTYTGTGSAATVGHGLGVAPSMVIVKRRNSTGSWPVYHTSLPSANYELFLERTDAQGTPSNSWNSTAPTSTVFSIGTGTAVNTNTGTYVAYCFAAISGFSAFGSYTGNGSADGPFVYTGFRPRWVMVKQATVSARDWIILDTARNTYNVADLQLMPNKSDAEATTVLSSTAYLDILSNGFKVRNTSVRNNENTATYIYACFAENPFKNALAR